MYSNLYVLLIVFYILIIHICVTGGIKVQT
nr:MAG TPA: hypothetical protein [Caudoviricetes sp.]DAR91039.1 MAG TPA: hypothetical protein [Caudoviricetes sp.]